jgi:hypothetical protein
MTKDNTAYCLHRRMPVPTPTPRTFTDDVLDDSMAAILRAKTPAERLAIAFGMWRFARDLMLRTTAAQHPLWSPAEVARHVARRMSHGAIGPAQAADEHV